MKSDGLLRHALVALVLTVVGYALLYTVIERTRTHKGGWAVTFTTRDAAPTLLINQLNLGVTNIQVRFPGAPVSTNASTTFVFNKPRPVPFQVPYGTCVFMDLRFLPGNVTFELFGHEIQLLPRVLSVDHTEHPWVSDSTLTLPPAREPAGKAAP